LAADGKFATAKTLVPQCLDMADALTIRRFFRKMWHYMDAYRLVTSFPYPGSVHRKGFDSRLAAFATRIYKSHRRVGTASEVQAALKAQEERQNDVPLRYSPSRARFSTSPVFVSISDDQKKIPLN
jgi:hypothetical protein